MHFIDIICISSIIAIVLGYYNDIIYLLVNFHKNGLFVIIFTIAKR